MELLLEFLKVIGTIFIIIFEKILRWRGNPFECRNTLRNIPITGDISVNIVITADIVMAGFSFFEPMNCLSANNLTIIRVQRAIIVMLSEDLLILNELLLLL
jgi:hypothetical protein